MMDQANFTDNSLQQLFPVDPGQLDLQRQLQQAQLQGRLSSQMLSGQQCGHPFMELFGGALGSFGLALGCLGPGPVGSALPMAPLLEKAQAGPEPLPSVPTFIDDVFEWYDRQDKMELFGALAILACWLIQRIG